MYHLIIKHFLLYELLVSISQHHA